MQRLTVAICGDIAHSRVARSNLILLGKMENRVRLIAPPTLMPAGVAELGCEVYDDMREGLKDADVVMMLRLQKERMDGGFIPSEREYYHRYGLDAEKLAYREGRRHRHASRPDEPRGRDRRRRWPTTSTARSFRTRSRWASRCAWPAWTFWRGTCGPSVARRRWG